jgi:hypothetical protein
LALVPIPIGANILFSVNGMDYQKGMARMEEREYMKEKEAPNELEASPQTQTQTTEGVADDPTERFAMMVHRLFWAREYEEISPEEYLIVAWVQHNYVPQRRCAIGHIRHIMKWCGSERTDQAF